MPPQRALRSAATHSGVFSAVWDSTDLALLILGHCDVPTLLAACGTCRRLRELDIDHLWKALVLQKWPPARSLRVASFKKLYFTWTSAEEGRKSQRSWRSELKRLQFVVQIFLHNDDDANPEKVVLLETTLRGEDAIPATDFHGVWDADSTPDDEEGLGWTCVPSPVGLRKFGVVLDEGEETYFASVASLYERDESPGRLACSCTVLRDSLTPNGPQAVGMLLNQAPFDDEFSGFHNKIFFLCSDDTRASIYLARDYGRAAQRRGDASPKPEWRLLLDMKGLDMQGDMQTADAVHEIHKRVQWHE